MSSTSEDQCVSLPVDPNSEDQYIPVADHKMEYVSVADHKTKYFPIPTLNTEYVPVPDHCTEYASAPVPNPSYIAAPASDPEYQYLPAPVPSTECQYLPAPGPSTEYFAVPGPQYLDPYSCGMYPTGVECPYVVVPEYPEKGTVGECGCWFPYQAVPTVPLYAPPTFVYECYDDQCPFDMKHLETKKPHKVTESGDSALEDIDTLTEDLKSLNLSRKSSLDVTALPCLALDFRDVIAVSDLLYSTLKGIPAQNRAPTLLTPYASPRSPGLLRVWGDHFSLLFRQLPGNWNLIFVTENIGLSPEEQAVKETAKVRFSCQSCYRGWTSMYGVVQFYYSYCSCTGRGYVRFLLCGQRCTHCVTSKRFEDPMWYPEEAQRVMLNVFYIICSSVYGLDVPLRNKVRRSGKPKNAHNKDQCQGCIFGLCR